MTLKRTIFQSCLVEDIERFLGYKRALARSFRTEEAALRLLDRYLVREGVTDLSLITSELMDRFLCSRPRKRPRSYNHLLGVTNRFFLWLVEQGRLPRSPVCARPKRETSRRLPFLFDVSQAKRLLETAKSLPDNSRAAFRGETYFMIFAILYGLGLRVGEVSRLCQKDVDFDRNLLIIRQTKFQKSRLVPFGPRIAERLKDYVQGSERRRGKLHPDDPVFSFGANKAVHPCTVSQVFHHMLPRLGLDVPEGVTKPRLHDLRHSFAVGTLLRWYKTGMEPSRQLVYLSTFLGHVDPDSTAVYLTITAELLREANQRFERFASPAVREVR